MSAQLTIQDNESVLIMSDTEKGDIVWEILIPEIDEKISSEISISSAVCAAIVMKIKEDPNFVNDLIEWFSAKVRETTDPDDKKPTLRRVK